MTTLTERQALENSRELQGIAMNHQKDIRALADTLKSLAIRVEEMRRDYQRIMVALEKANLI